jgi:hypothetical protein
MLYNYKAIIQLDHKEPSPDGTHKIRTENGTEKISKVIS